MSSDTIRTMADRPESLASGGGVCKKETPRWRLWSYHHRVGRRVSPARAGEKDIFGWVEHVLVGESHSILMAKLDTGADTSSMHATKIRRYRSSDRKLWVEFRLTDEPRTGPSASRRSWSGTPIIKEHEGPSQKRPVVNVTICLGDHEKEIEVSWWIAAASSIRFCSAATPWRGTWSSIPSCGSRPGPLVRPRRRREEGPALDLRGAVDSGRARVWPSTRSSFSVFLYGRQKNLKSGRSRRASR